MEEKNEIESRPCGTAVLWEMMAQMTPEEREEFDKKLSESIKQWEQNDDVTFL
ncbi:hypothetical protein [Sulfurovum sp.]|jgi:hypothetical protein|uniref:hypothetical protein n=1 Tax=Sulfurovum sp. TaxID=1969726 RepID=UPI002A365600|nr:hypothetical protein [Sulfurovum sp.]MDY0401986.1 hypothetical protein [Sulfurovum sp.]